MSGFGSSSNSHLAFTSSNRVPDAVLIYHIPTKKELSGAVGKNHYVSWDSVWFCRVQTEMEFSLHTGIWKREVYYSVTLRITSCWRGRGYFMLGSGVKGIISFKVQSYLQIMRDCALQSNVNSSVYFTPRWLTWDKWRGKLFLRVIKSTKIFFSLHYAN